MSIKNSHCIITGGAGAIGSYLVNKLLGLECNKITIIDDLSSGYTELLPTDKRINFINMDVCRIMETNAIAGEDAYVFHLAAFFANQNSVDFPDRDLHTNGLGTLELLRWSAKQNVKRVVYASAGCSIAGHGINKPISEDMPVSLHLDTPYQITKALGEFYCNYFLQQVSTVRCRFFNSYGPGEIPGTYRNVIPNFIWWAMNNIDLPITGTGEETRDFIYVDDLTEGLILAATSTCAHGEAYNLGTGQQTKIIEMAKAVIELCGSKSKIVFKERRAWDNSTTRQADISKVTDQLNFNPKVNFIHGLEKTVKWYKENNSLINSILISR